MHIVLDVFDLITIGILGFLLLASGVTIAILYIAEVLKEYRNKK